MRTRTLLPLLLVLLAWLPGNALADTLPRVSCSPSVSADTFSRSSFAPSNYTKTAFGETFKATSGIQQRYTFAGREASANAGAGAPMFYRNRMYAPTLGRFGRRDPKLGGDPLYNAYGYPFSNAVIWLDPWGMAGKEPSTSLTWSDSAGTSHTIQDVGDDLPPSSSIAPKLATFEFMPIFAPRGGRKSTTVDDFARLSQVLKKLADSKCYRLNVRTRATTEVLQKALCACDVIEIAAHGGKDKPYLTLYDTYLEGITKPKDVDWTLTGDIRDKEGRNPSVAVFVYIYSCYAQDIQNSIHQQTAPLGGGYISLLGNAPPGLREAASRQYQSGKRIIDVTGMPHSLGRTVDVGDMIRGLTASLESELNLCDALHYDKLPDKCKPMLCVLFGPENPITPE